MECGVWKGGCSLLMAEANNRDIWMYDTYAGMSEPGKFDFKGAAPTARKSAMKRFNENRRENYTDWCYASLESVREAVELSGLSVDRFKYIRGKIEDTIPKEMPEQIALLRLDTDFYESTKHELEYLYPRLSPGGILIIDDYGAWNGAKKAVDEFFLDKPLMIPEMTYGCMFCVKPPMNNDEN